MAIGYTRRILDVERYSSSEGYENENQRIKSVTFNVYATNQDQITHTVSTHRYATVENVIEQLETEEAKENEYYFYTHETQVKAPVLIGTTDKGRKYIYSKPNDSEKDNLLTIADRNSK